MLRKTVAGKNLVIILPILWTTNLTFLVEIQKAVFIFTESGEAEKALLRSSL
jgi:hypothetical protein